MRPIIIIFFFLSFHSLCFSLRGAPCRSWDSLISITWLGWQDTAHIPEKNPPWINRNPPRSSAEPDQLPALWSDSFLWDQEVSWGRAGLVSAARWRRALGFPLTHTQPDHRSGRGELADLGRG